ncbi:MAG: hypothetical protein K1X88_24975, partial [Nannocystaceae bacterium]|nr:hypothetical protein [Nannocystaceae bacterium]
AALLSSLRAAARPRRRGAIAAAAAVLVGGITVAAWRPWRAPAPPAPVAHEPASAPAIAAPAVVEPWRVTLRPLTKTPPPGIEGAAIDPAGREILYTLGDAALRRPLEGGTPVPLSLPGESTPWFVGYDRDGAPLVVVDGALWRYGEDAAPVAVLRELPSFEYLERSPDGGRIAALGDLQLTWWSMPQGTRHTVALPGERPAGLSWSRDGALLAVRSWPVGGDDENLRVFDRDGVELARTKLPVSDVEGLAWLGDRTLVVAAGASGELQLQCLSWSPGTRSLETVARSEPMAIAWAQSYLVGVTDDHRGLFTVVREVEDVAAGRLGRADSWATLAPSRDAGNSSAAWLTRDRIAMWSDRDLQPTIVLDDLAGHTTLAPLGSLGRPRQVAVTADGTMVVTLARDETQPSRLAVMPPDASSFTVLPDRGTLASALVDLRCDGVDAPRGCVGLLERDGQRLLVRFDAAIEAGAAVLHEAACPVDHLCLYGAFAPIDGGAAVVLPTADYRQLDRIVLDGGAIEPSGVAPPPGYDATGAAPVPGRPGELVVTLTANTAARGDVPTYLVALLAPGRASRTLWSSASTYSARPIVAPGGQRVAVDASVFHEEAMLLEGLSSCAQRADPGVASE